jgi:chromosome segregation ATPase
MWTSYSDLFLGLSVIFLLLYVTASLRQGTDGIRQHLDNQQLSKQNEDLKQQLKVYESLKQDYLANQASKDEQQTYENLMSKLKLLQDDANQEKANLQKAAQENADKATALNQYQQTIRNIINANLLSKARIKNRDVLITKRDTTIEGQSQEITEQQTQLEEKRKELVQNQNKVAALQDTLAQKLKQLDNAYKAKRVTERIYLKRQESLKRETEKKVAALNEKNRAAEEVLQDLNQKLQKTSTELAQTGAENQKLQGELSQATQKYQEDMGRLKSEFNAQKARDRNEFEKQLAKEKLSGAERAEREAQFRAASENKARELAQKMAAVEGRYKAAQGELSNVKGALTQTKAELERAQENLNARKKLAAAINERFKANGVRAQVNPLNGDVLLSFDGEYFDTGAAQLKPGMKKVLEKAMPAYAQSLFEDPKIASKIENVEIVGFASPTYNGHYVDPSKLSLKDRTAVNYNMDLSYGRARAIFDHMFSKMQFQHKQKLLPLAKVTGRSFLSDKDDRTPASQGQQPDFCKQIDCAKQQTVVIRFKLKD